MTLTRGYSGKEMRAALFQQWASHGEAQYMAVASDAGLQELCAFTDTVKDLLPCEETLDNVAFALWQCYSHQSQLVVNSALAEEALWCVLGFPRLGRRILVSFDKCFWCEKYSSLECVLILCTVSIGMSLVLFG